MPYAVHKKVQHTEVTAMSVRQFDITVRSTCCETAKSAFVIKNQTNAQL
jgi:hypothetical protein